MSLCCAKRLDFPEHKPLNELVNTLRKDTLIDFIVGYLKLGMLIPMVSLKET